MVIHLLSANRKDKYGWKIKNTRQTGTVIKSAEVSPAVITPPTFFGAFSERYFIISRETVIGIPETHADRISEKRDRATWYSPIPSVPIVLDKNILYKNPNAFSHTEKTVTIKTVL